MIWHLAHRFDARGARLADRHYSRRKVGAPQFVAPSSNLVLITAEGDAVWATIIQQIVKHDYAGAWLCSIFRNESPHLSSAMIRDACAASRAHLGEPPAEGLITFVDPRAVRHKRDPGRCFRRAGFRVVGLTRKRRLLVLRLDPEDFPPADFAIGEQVPLGGAA